MPRQTRNPGGSDLPESSTGSDVQQQSEHHESSLNNRASGTTGLHQRLNQIAEELRQMQERPAPVPAPVTAAVPAVPAKMFKLIDLTPFCGGAEELERYLTSLRINFESHRHLFPRGSTDYIRYTMKT